jgi:uncharacterized protein involved in exopolysaccharide biosynthesis
MKLRVGPEEEGHDPLSMAVKLPASKLAESLDSRMRLDIDVLQSGDMLSQIVLKLGLQKLEVADDGRTGVTSAVSIDKALQRLRVGLKIEREKDSNILDVSYSAPTPEIASAALQNLANFYPRARAALYGESGQYKFLHRQSASWHDQMNEAENDLVHFRRRYSGFVLPEERTALGKRSIEAQAAFEQADAQVAQYRKKVADTREKLKGINPATAERIKAGLKSDSVGRAVMTLVDLIERKADLDGRAPTDIRIQREADERIQNARLKVIKALSQTDNGRNVELTAVQQNAEINLITSETELAGLEALRRHLRHTADEYKQEMFQLADAEVRDDSLLRQVKRTEEQYLLYSRWQEQWRVAESLTKESVANFGVVQSPTVPLEPSTPHVFTDLALASLLSMCCGLAAVLCAEYLTPTALRSYANLGSIPAAFDLMEPTE